MVRSPTLMVLVLAPLAFVEIEGSAVAVTRGAVCNELGRSCLRECDNSTSDELAHTQCLTVCNDARAACNVGNAPTRNSGNQIAPGSSTGRGSTKVGVQPPTNAGSKEPVSGGSSGHPVIEERPGGGGRH